MKLVVLIPTYRRPQSLLKTLTSLISQDAFESVEIVVSDNDSEKTEGLFAAQGHASVNAYTQKLHLRTEAQKGFAQNRNAGLQYAFGNLNADAVAMIDDDATADPGWLREIHKAVKNENASVYGGPTLYVAGPEAESWLTELDLFKPPYSSSGPVQRLRSSNNCIIMRDLWERFDRHLFDERFSETGGEDTKLFTCISDEGLRSYWIEPASVTEPIPQNRANLGWVLQRHCASAAINAQIDHQMNGTQAIARQGALAVKEFFSGSLKLFDDCAKTRFIGRMRIRGAVSRFGGLRNVNVLHDTHARSD